MRLYKSQTVCTGSGDGSNNLSTFSECHSPLLLALELGHEVEMLRQSVIQRREDGLCFLSLDAGGTRAISQLAILADVMHTLNFDYPEDDKKRPCDVFDMIGGTGTGGFIAILLVLFGLGAEHATLY